MAPGPPVLHQPNQEEGCPTLQMALGIHPSGHAQYPVSCQPTRASLLNPAHTVPDLPKRVELACTARHFLSHNWHQVLTEEEGRKGDSMSCCLHVSLGIIKHIYLTLTTNPLIKTWENTIPCWLWNPENYSLCFLMTMAKQYLHFSSPLVS